MPATAAPTTGYRPAKEVDKGELGASKQQFTSSVAEETASVGAHRRVRRAKGDSNEAKRDRSLYSSLHSIVKYCAIFHTSIEDEISCTRNLCMLET